MVVHEDKTDDAATGERSESPVSKDCLLQGATDDPDDFTFDLDIVDHPDSLGFYDDWNGAHLSEPIHAFNWNIELVSCV